MEEGSCLTWTTTWWTRGDDGREVAPGRYEMRFAVLTDNVGAPNDALTQTYRYSVEEDA